MEAGTLRARGGPAIGNRSSRARALDPLLRWVLTGLAALILILIAFFFIRLFVEAKPAFDKFGYIGFVFDNNWDVSKGIFGAWPLLVGTHPHVGHRARDRGARGHRHRAVHLRAVPAPGAPAADHPRRAAGRGALGRLRPVGHHRAGTQAPAGRAVVLGQVLVPAPGRRLGLDPQLLHRRPDHGDHDPAHRLGHLARGHGDGTGAGQGGGARARRHALGDDPDRRAALLAGRHLGRRDARPRARDRARRSR